MKPKFANRRHLLASVIAMAFGPALLATSASAAPRTWVGDTDANLATAANWDVVDPQTTPASGDSWVFGAAGTAGAALTNDLTASTAFEVAGITFGGSAAAYTISGGNFSLTGNIATTSTTSQIIGSNIAISGSRQVNLNGTQNITLSGNLSGNGSLTQTAGGSGAKSLALSGDNSGFSGTFIQTNDGNNRTAFNSASAGSSSAAWTFNRNVNGGVALNFTNTTIDFGSLAGGGFVRANQTGTVTVRAGDLDTSTTFSGILQQAGAGTILALNKIGSGTLTLSGANPYAGATIVDNGTLDVTGTITSSAVTVNNSGTIFQISGSSKTLAGLTVNAGGTAKVGAVSTITNAVVATGSSGSPGIVDFVNGSAGTMNVNGSGGLTLGGAAATDTAQLKLEVGGTADLIYVTNGLTVDAGGASIQISNLGLSAGQSYPLIDFASGSGAGFATGTGTTVGALSLANPNLSFGISGQLEVTDFGVNLVTTGATPPNSAYWSGAQGSTWASTSGSNANFTTTAAGGTFLNVLPGANTMVYFSNNSPSNLTNTLGGNFDIFGLTYRGTSAAVTTSGTDTLTLEDGGIIVESGNGGATLAMDNLVLAQNQFWTNNSSNPLTVSAASITGPSTALTMDGTGSVHLGGTSLSVDALGINTNLDLKGTAVTANLADSSGNITNSGADTTLTANNSLDASLDGVISDNGTGSLLQFVKTGNASVTLSGNNSHGGGTSLAGGTLVAGHNNAFGSGVMAITNGAAVLDLNGATIDNPLTNSGTTGAQITNNSATEAVVTSGFNFANATGFVIGDFTVNGSGDIRWDGAIKRTNGTGTMTKSGSNTLTINEDNGTAPIGGMNLVVSDGTLFLGRTTALSFANLTINGGTLKMDPLYQVSTGANVWQGTFSNEAFMNGGVWDLNDTGTNGISNRVKRINGTGGTITNNGTGASMLVLAARDTATPSWAGNIQDGTGTVALTIQWGGSVNQVMQFSGAHTYSGDTYIRENVMQAGAANVFSPNSNFVIPNHPTGGKLDLNSFDNTIGSLGGDEPDAQVLLGTATLTTGGTDADTTFPGVISGGGGLTKVGAGTFALTGTNTYTGNTTVSNGTLSLSVDYLDDNSTVTVDTGAVLNLDHSATDVVGTLVLGGTTYTSGLFDSSHPSGLITGTGKIQVGSVAGYASWAELNGATGQTADQDHDNDGVDNGVEYFMGQTGSSFTANPPVVVSGSDRTVTWPKDPAFSGTYQVQTSPDLVTWADVTGSVVDNGTSVVYTFPAPSGKLFVRLVVTPN